MRLRSRHKDCYLMHRMPCRHRVHCARAAAKRSTCSSRTMHAKCGAQAIGIWPQITSFAIKDGYLYTMPHWLVELKAHERRPNVQPNHRYSGTRNAEHWKSANSTEQLFSCDNKCFAPWHTYWDMRQGHTSLLQLVMQIFLNKSSTNLIHTFRGKTREKNILTRKTYHQK